MNIRLTIQYDGTDFCGSQFQPGFRTVQSELESSLNVLFGYKVSTIFSGRTDSGVHAKEQTVNFFLHDDYPVPPDKIIHPLNKLLPPDILTVSSEKAPEDFHARFSAKKRTYRYFIRRTPDLFRERYSLLFPREISIDHLNSFTDIFKSKQDFSSLCSSRSDTENRICEIFELLFFSHGDETIMEITADRFLHNMVRIIVSVFLEISGGKLCKNDVTEMLLSKDRKVMPKTISPKGLFLWRVTY